LTLGRQSYSEAELLTILKTPTRADASLILAKQLIAAKLNIANGSNPAPISDALTDADALLTAFEGKLPYGVTSSSTAGKAMLSDAATVDNYSSGKLTEGCTP
jgi:hypothetical protein